MGGKTLSYKEYIASDTWKCDKSPIGGHHWVGLEVCIDGYQLFHCKYCEELSMKPHSHDAAMGYSAGKADRVLRKFQEELKFKKVKLDLQEKLISETPHRNIYTYL